MRTEIKNNLENPMQLEKLYRENKAFFKKEFNTIYPEIQETETGRIWNARLNFQPNEITGRTNKELIFVVIASLLAGVIAKIPDFTFINPEFFYPRNLGFIVFPFLITYFGWREKIQIKKLLVVSLVMILSAVYINFLPHVFSDTLILACIHLPLVLWALLGFTFSGENPGDYPKRLEFLRYNGDLIVMSAVLLIAGVVFTLITFGLFQFTDINIEEFYFGYIVKCGLASVPLVATFLVRSNPHLVNKVSPLIAKIFTPFVLVMLVIYLFAVFFSEKSLYTDRDLLLIFNIMLIGVMAIIFFSIAETTKNITGRIQNILLFVLSIVAILVNGIALSAILYRVAEWGISPNRLAVLGGNVLIMTNLIIVSRRLFKAIKNNKEIEKVENSIAAYLPVYALWAVIVTFIFPLLFNFE